MIKFHIVLDDGSKTLEPITGEIRILVEDDEGLDGRRLNLLLTSEGLITDVVDGESGEVSGTESEMWDEMVYRLAGAPE